MFQVRIEGKIYEVKEQSDWKTCIENDFKVGDYFNEEIACQLINCLPPHNFGNCYFQCGEVHEYVNGRATYLTLIQIYDIPEIWRFLGYCYGGEEKEPVKEGV